MEENVLYFNIIITLTSLWVMARVYKKFIVPSNYNLYRFKLFQLRDDLALVAMRGEIAENDKTYRLLMMLLNTSIRALDDFSVVNYVKLLMQMNRDGGLKQKVDGLVNKLENSESEDIKNITKQYFEISNEILRKHTRGMRLFVVPTLKVFVLPLLKFAIEIVSFPENLYAAIEQEAFDVGSIQESNRQRISKIESSYEHCSTA